MSFRPFVPLLLASIALLAACTAGPPSTPAPKELVVFAAASLAEPFSEIGAQFGAANGGARVSFKFGGSPQLRTQLEQGARADLFASANRDQMDLAVRNGVVVGDTPVFVQNKLVVVMPRDDPGRIERLDDLGRPGLKLLTTQRNVPVGQYTQDALAKMSRDPRFGADYQARVNANVRSEEADVKQVVAKVQLGEADAAVVYATDVSPRVSAELRTIPIPDQFNTVADYPIDRVEGSAADDLGRAFIAYLVSGPGRDVLRKYNFILPERSATARLLPRA